MNSETITEATYEAIKQAYCLNFHIYANPEYVVVKKFTEQGYNPREVRCAIEKFKVALLSTN